MILIRKQTPPTKYDWYCKIPFSTFDGMPSDVKKELRASLLKEQGFLCAYCMTRINNEKDTKIDHFVPRNPQNELEYSNLLAVCKGNEGYPYEEATCDTRKGDKKLKHVNPQKKECIATITYKRNGTICSTNPEIEKELNEILNLNCPNGYLISNRRCAVAALFSSFRGKDNKTIKTTLRNLKRKYGMADKKEPYVGILLYFIEKKIRKI